MTHCHSTILYHESNLYRIKFQGVKFMSRIPINPISTEALMNIFNVSRNNPSRIINRESTTIEFKESYHRNVIQYFRTIASFANRNGGYIIFGVKDSPRELIGLDNKHLNEFENLKVEEFTQKLNEYFSPEINWLPCTFEFKDRHFGVIYVYSLKNKPCICKKNNESSDLKEGEIYYRYSGRSERIRYTELSAIIEETRKNEAHRWFDLIKKVARIGIENSVLLDLSTGKLSNSGTPIVIDEKIIKQIAFIHQGRFVETGGTPTLRIIGELKGIPTGKMMLSSPQKIVIKAIEPNDLINAFLDNLTINSPLEYLKRICSDTSAYAPIYFILQQAKIFPSEAMKIVEDTNTRNKSTKNKIIERLKGKKISKIDLPKSEKSSTAKIKNTYRKNWLSENITDIDNISYCMDALLSLTNSEVTLHIEYIKKILSQIFKNNFDTLESNVVTKIRKAICRIDEIVYFKESTSSNI